MIAIFSQVKANSERKLYGQCPFNTMLDFSHQLLQDDFFFPETTNFMNWKIHNVNIFPTNSGESRQ